MSRYPGWFDSFFAWEVPRHSSKEYSAGAQQGARRVHEFFHVEMIEQVKRHEKAMAWKLYVGPAISGPKKLWLYLLCYFLRSIPRVPVIQKLDDGRLFHQRTAEFVDPIIRSGPPNKGYLGYIRLGPPTYPVHKAYLSIPFTTGPQSIN